MLDRQHNEFPILIGSGVSIAGGLPSVDTISDSVASNLGGTNHAQLFGAIKGLCEEDRRGQKSNYEDWVFLASQVRDHLLRDYENPGLIPLISHLHSRVTGSHDQMREGANTILDVILKSVCGHLAAKSARFADAFPKLAQSVLKNPTTAFRFFTLNHDTLLEQCLRESKVGYYDGFEKQDSEAARTLAFDLEKYRGALVSLVKLHGSVDWWRLRPYRASGERNPWLLEFFGIQMRSGEFDRMDQTPLILAGTFNKILQYSSPQFLGLIAEFYATLQRASSLLVCGYGFGDKGVNSIVIDWMSSKSDRTLTVVDPQPFEPQRCRGAVFAKVELWQKEGRLRIIAKPIGTALAWDAIFAETGLAA